MASSSWFKASLFCMVLEVASPSPAKAGLIDGGINHACALDSEGAVWCWGDNSSGQLGIGAGTEALAFPVRINPMTNFDSRKLVSISTGYFHSCALDSKGEAWCWGENGDGQLGIGNNTDQFIPQKVSMLNVTSQRVVSIAAGSAHTCAIDADGNGFCWGSDDFGALGDNAVLSYKNVPTPVAMPAGAEFVALSAGFESTCALGASKAWCWGSNVTGDLGIGNSNLTSTPTPLPIALPPGIQFRSVSSRQHQACALDSDGKAWCWGKFDGDTPVSVSMDSLPPGTKFAQISLGNTHICALDSVGVAWCWGNDYSGQLGNDNIREHKTVPTRVPLDPSSEKLEAIAAGYEFTCAIAATGKVSCWGNNTYGQLGSGEFGSVTYAQPALLADAVQVTAGQDHTCALDTQGRAWCWGQDDNGELGDGPPAAGIRDPSACRYVQPPDGFALCCHQRRAGSHVCAPHERRRLVLGPRWFWPTWGRIHQLVHGADTRKHDCCTDRRLHPTELGRPTHLCPGHNRPNLVLGKGCFWTVG
jgi:alpha-tubulin suppressor-like RCC1 family protein